MAAEGLDPKTVELTAIIREIQDRVRARYPLGDSGGSVPLPDLMPIVHARDAAEGKVAAIGTVNPRPPGLLNNLIQFVKRTVARVLDWHVREQVEFNRAVMQCVEAELEALNEIKRSLAAIDGLIRESRQRSEEQARNLQTEAAELKDIRVHCAEWRNAWEQKLAANEIQFLRSISETQAAHSHRLTLQEQEFRDLVRQQHREFTTALERAVHEIQERLWADLEKVRGEFERLIHQELRLASRRVATAPVSPAPAVAQAPVEQPQVNIDFVRFAERFRGSEEHVRETQRFYVPHFKDCRSVLDVGCGRGEFLDLMREAGVSAQGVEQSEELVRYCQSKGLNVSQGDLFEYLDSLPDASLDGLFCCHVVEHLPVSRLPEFIALAARKLQLNGLLAIETPNPECLAIFATFFYLDPTHLRPVPPALLCFCLEEAGFGRLHVQKLAPASQAIPSLLELPENFRETFFGGFDYTVLARRIS